MRPPVSVIVPVCDSAPWLERCIDSLLAQSLPGLEIILVDDASTDESPALCVRYAEQYPDRIRYIALPQRRGPGAARNTGMAQAQGAFWGFVDSDDAVAPEMYAELHSRAKEEESDIVVCGYRLVSESGSREFTPRPTGALQATQLLLQRKIQPTICNKLLSKSFVDATQITFPETYCGEDMAFVFMLMMENPRLYAIARPLYIYYYRRSSISVNILHRKSILESLLHVKQHLIANGKYYEHKYKYAYICLMHAVYYPMQLFIRSLLHGENRSTTFKNLLEYAYVCCRFVFTNRV